MKPANYTEAAGRFCDGRHRFLGSRNPTVTSKVNLKLYFVQKAFCGLRAVEYALRTTELHYN